MWKKTSNYKTRGKSTLCLWVFLSHGVYFFYVFNFYALNHFGIYFWHNLSFILFLQICYFCSKSFLSKFYLIFSNIQNLKNFAELQKNLISFLRHFCSTSLNSTKFKFPLPSKMCCENKSKIQDCRSQRHWIKKGFIYASFFFVLQRH